MKNPFRITVARRFYTAVLAALLPVALATPAQAATDQVDQSMAATSAFSFQSNVAYMAQTFTAGMTGQVDRVTLPVYTPTGFASISVSLRGAGTNGMPTTTVLATSPTVSTGLTCCSWHDFAFPTPYPSVTSGAHYAIVVHVTLGSLRWPDSGITDAYAGGRQYIGGSATSWFTTSHGDFGFKEWVSTNVNLAPSVTSASGALSVPEGTAATNSGTCGDTDGDTVNLTASSGTVSACTGGAWTWTQPASDEAPTQTVTITADDGQGLTTTTSFTVDVVAVAPVAQILSDPPSVPEGSTVPFTGGATSPDAADNTAGFTYTWTVTENSAAYASGSGASFSFVPKDDGSYVVSFTAKDDGGMSGTTSMILLVTNVAPRAAISSVTPSAPLVTTAGESLSFRGTFTDADSADSYTITWNFGDGRTATGSSVTHAYSAPGTYTVVYQVGDGEGGVGQATATVTVQTTQQALASIGAYVDTLGGLNAGQRNSLHAKLDAASASASRGNTVAASNQLNAFLNELQAYVNSGKVSAASAATLRAAVHTVQGGLGTLSRLLQIWPIRA